MRVMHEGIQCLIIIILVKNIVCIVVMENKPFSLLYRYHCIATVRVLVHLLFSLREKNPLVSCAKGDLYMS